MSVAVLVPGVYTKAGAVLVGLHRACKLLFASFLAENLLAGIGAHIDIERYFVACLRAYHFLTKLCTHFALLVFRVCISLFMMLNCVEVFVERLALLAAYPHVGSTLV